MTSSLTSLLTDFPSTAAQTAGKASLSAGSVATDGSSFDSQLSQHLGNRSAENAQSASSSSSSGQAPSGPYVLQDAQVSGATVAPASLSNIPASSSAQVLSGASASSDQPISGTTLSGLVIAAGTFNGGFVTSTANGMTNGTASSASRPSVAEQTASAPSTTITATGASIVAPAITPAVASSLVPSGALLSSSPALSGATAASALTSNMTEGEMTSVSPSDTTLIGNGGYLTATLSPASGSGARVSSSASDSSASGPASSDTASDDTASSGTIDPTTLAMAAIFAQPVTAPPAADLTVSRTVASGTVADTSIPALITVTGGGNSLPAGNCTVFSTSADGVSLSGGMPANPLSSAGLEEFSLPQGVSSAAQTGMTQTGSSSTVTTASAGNAVTGSGVIVSSGGFSLPPGVSAQIVQTSPPSPNASASVSSGAQVIPQTAAAAVVGSFIQHDSLRRTTEDARQNRDSPVSATTGGTATGSPASSTIATGAEISASSATRNRQEESGSATDDGFDTSMQTEADAATGGDGASFTQHQTAPMDLSTTSTTHTAAATGQPTTAATPMFGTMAANASSGAPSSGTTATGALNLMVSLQDEQSPLHVTIDRTSQESGLSIQIGTDSATTLNDLQTHRHDLLDALENAGVATANATLSFSVTDNAPGSSFQQSDPSQNAGQSAGQSTATDKGSSDFTNGFADTMAGNTGGESSGGWGSRAQTARVSVGAASDTADVETVSSIAPSISTGSVNITA